MNKSLFGQYIEEKEHREIIENDYGFIVYKIEKDECHISELFVSKEHRRSKVGTELADKVQSIAKEAGCKYLTCFSMPCSATVTGSLMAKLQYGFKVHSCQQDRIVLFKEIL
jgi:GNAT superfamily N-acetyltransferase